MLFDYFVGNFFSLGHIFQLIGKPVKAFIQSVTRGRTRSLNVPLPASHLIKTQLLGDLRATFSIGKILQIHQVKWLSAKRTHKTRQRRFKMIALDSSLQHRRRVFVD